MDIYGVEEGDLVDVERELGFGSGVEFEDRRKLMLVW